MNILGITHTIELNQAACILVDGNLIAAVEEERLIRIKHAVRGLFPKNAVNYCLQKAGITAEDIDIVAIGWEKPPNFNSLNLLKYAYRARARKNARRSIGEIPLLLRMKGEDDALRMHIKRFTKARIVHYNHHLAHAASAVFTSPFDSGIFMTLDGRGMLESGLLGSYKNDEIEVLSRIPVKSSLGYMYQYVTGLLGFTPHSHEGKVMGLSVYGDPQKYKFGEYKGNFKIDVNWKMIEKMGNEFASKQFDDNPTQNIKKDIAATVQRDLEEISLHLLEDLVSITGSNNLVLAGGTCLNCNMNKNLYKSGLIKDIFIQPAANDAGAALGAAILAALESGDKPKIKFNHAYWGPSYTNDEIKSVLDTSKIKYEFEEDIEGTAAELLSKGNIIGWYNGRLEFGPRALGARSILADPSDPGMKDKINYFVKHREWWRPFAPSMLREYSHRYNIDIENAPFMIITSKVKEENLDEIISATHIDKTCRPQTVEEKFSPAYYKVINNFRKITGIPAVLNTSFNIRGQPIVCRPNEAIGTFFSTGMDYLMIGNYIVTKQQNTLR